MSTVVLTVVDVFRIDERGTIVTGYRGGAWANARRGTQIELRAPSGQRIRTSIRDLEELHPCFTSDDRLYGGVLFEDKVAADHAPSGTELVEVSQ